MATKDSAVFKLKPSINQQWNVSAYFALWKGIVYRPNLLNCSEIPNRLYKQIPSTYWIQIKTSGPGKGWLFCWTGVVHVFNHTLVCWFGWWPVPSGFIKTLPSSIVCFHYEGGWIKVTTPQSLNPLYLSDRLRRANENQGGTTKHAH